MAALFARAAPFRRLRMKLSTKVRYGVRAMVDLAINQEERPVLVKAIAERQSLSKKYLESLLASLKTAGLLRSVRGAKGGYLLARPPEEITLEMVTNALDGPIALTDCIDAPDTCGRARDCATRELWRDLTEALREKLREITLAELARRCAKKENKHRKA
jgi:Rrf2 family transcriptional regulator, cysteine metabolism repressor